MKTERKVSDGEKVEQRDRSGGGVQEEGMGVVRTASQHEASTETSSRTATCSRRRRRDEGQQEGEWAGRRKKRKRRKILAKGAEISGVLLTSGDIEWVSNCKSRNSEPTSTCFMLTFKLYLQHGASRSKGL